MLYLSKNSSHTATAASCDGASQSSLVVVAIRVSFLYTAKVGIPSNVSLYSGDDLQVLHKRSFGGVPYCKIQKVAVCTCGRIRECKISAQTQFPGKQRHTALNLEIRHTTDQLTNHLWIVFGNDRAIVRTHRLLHA